MSAVRPVNWVLGYCRPRWMAAAGFQVHKLGGRQEVLAIERAWFEARGCTWIPPQE